MLSEHFFGELESFDEAKNHLDFFLSTFVVPSSMSTESLSNKKKFIVLGRKGVGKTATQMNLAKELNERGYFTHIFRFMYDLRSDDYAEIAKSQSDISYADATNSKKLFLHYDFRDVWERVFFQRIGEKLLSEGKSSKFTEFVAPKGSKFRNIFEGISKRLSIKIGADFGPIVAEFGFDPNETKELPLKSFNRISRELFKNNCKEYQMYFFVDELVFSRLDAKPDEIHLRAAMVRDILKCAWELNNFCAQNELEFHFICSLRPEVRNLINDMDSEAGKFLDGKDVELSWLASDGQDSKLIIEVLRKKIEHSHFKRPNYNDFMTEVISFGARTLTLNEFLMSNTWGRPRDIIRLLIAIQKKSPNAEQISEVEIKAALDDYSRASARELIDELGVNYGADILKALRAGINRKTYSSKSKFWQAISPNISEISSTQLIDELFNIGLICGYEPLKGYYFWAHRGENFLKDHHSIRIHPALWNEFSIRDT